MEKHYLRVRNLVHDLVERERGAAMAEYGLLVALIAVVCIGAVTALGAGVSGTLGEAAGAM
jgi:pilus assembly protein Flp/PilA